MSKPVIKNFFPDCDVIQVKTGGHEIVIWRTKEGDTMVDVRTFETGEEHNLVLGEASPEPAPIQDATAN